MTTALNIKNLTYPKQSGTLFEDLSLRVAPGECVAIVGPSGGGKSTLFDLVFSSKTNSYGGEIVINSEQAALVLQDGALLDHLNVMDNAKLVNAYASERLDTQSLENILTSLNVPPEYFNRNVNELSGGEKRRVAIARALITNPEIVFFDEPDAGLDISNRHTLADVFNQLKPNGKAIVFTTHDSLLASLTADKIYCLIDGTLVPVKQDITHRDTLEKGIEQLLNTQSSDKKRARKSASEALSALQSLLACALTWFKPIKSLSFFARSFGKVLWTSAIAGIPFFFLVGLMLGATTIVVVNNLVENALLPAVRLFIKPEFVLSQLDGLFIAFFAPAIGGILYVARSGSIVTSWLGVLSYGQQLKALNRLRVNTDSYLRTPTLLASFLSYLIVVIVFGLGMWVGSFMTAEQIYNIENARLQYQVTWPMVPFVNGKAKLILYGVLISVAICTLGMARKNRVDSVARHTTLSIIISTVAIAMAELWFAFYG